MKRIGIFVIVLGLLFRNLAVVYAREWEFTEGDLIYVIEDEGIIITGYFGSDLTVVIPREIAGLPVSEIGEGAFKDTSVTKLILPESIMKISGQAIPTNCQVEYEEGAQSEQGEGGAGKNPEENTGNNMTKNVIREVDSADMSQTDDETNTYSTAGQEIKISSQYNNSAEDLSAQEISAHEKDMNKNTGAKHKSVDSKNNNTDEENAGRAVIDEAEIELEDSQVESAIQVELSGESNALQSASENVISVEDDSISTERNESDLQATEHEKSPGESMIQAVSSGESEALESVTENVLSGENSTLFAENESNSQATVNRGKKSNAVSVGVVAITIIVLVTVIVKSINNKKRNHS